MPVPHISSGAVGVPADQHQCPSDRDLPRVRATLLALSGTWTKAAPPLWQPPGLRSWALREHRQLSHRQGRERKSLTLLTTIFHSPRTLRPLAFCWTGFIPCTCLAGLVNEAACEPTLGCRCCTHWQQETISIPVLMTDVREKCGKNLYW